MHLASILISSININIYAADKMKKTVTAAEAASLLGISLPTLYAYVSRGLLHSLQEDGVRSKRYLHEEVLRLAARNTDGKRAGRTAERAIDWGVPVLESSITLIADGRLLYRGHDAAELAQHASLEQVAALLWECSEENAFSEEENGKDGPQVPLRLWQDLQAPLVTLPPLDRAMSLLPAIAPRLQHTWGRTGAAMQRSGAALMRVLSLRRWPAAASAAFPCTASSHKPGSWTHSRPTCCARPWCCVQIMN